MAKQNVILKLSGNGLGDPKKHKIVLDLDDVDPSTLNINPDKVEAYAQNIIEVNQKGFKPFVIIGGSNIANGKKLYDEGFVANPLDGDLLGMKATHYNVEQVYRILKKMDEKDNIFMLSTIGRDDGDFIAYTPDMLAWMRKKEDIICLIAGGTGYAGFSTDTAAAVIAYNIGMDRIIKATQAGGVYNQDPRYPKPGIETIKYPFISYDDVLSKHLDFMDRAAIATCEQNNTDIYVTGNEDIDTMVQILIKGQNPNGSLVTSKEKVLRLTNPNYHRQ